MTRWRAIIAFTLTLVVGTASVGVCALLCDLSRPVHVVEAAAQVSSCHQPAADAKPLPGPGYGQPASHCPVLAALSAEGREVVPAAASALSFSFGSWPAALPNSALEIPRPRLRASRSVALAPPSLSPLPLYLERGVLRI